MTMIEILCKSGFALFAAGLCIGAMIPRFKNPRLGLSAHLTAVQAGAALMAMGAMWPTLSSHPTAGTVLGHVISASSWSLVGGLTLAAVYGASRVLPIAGSATRGTPMQERLVATIVLGSSVILTAATLGIIALWFVKP